MALDTQEILDRLASHAKSLGLFDRVNKHEPKSPPGRGLSCAIWVERIDPAGSMSGVRSTTGRITFNVRIYSNMLQEPQDGIDPNIIRATDALIRAYSGDFTLGGAVMAVDLLGMSGGQGMFAQAGYLRMNESRIYRSVTLWVPLLVADLWAQSE
ncbi:hypothetical protein [Streptomyces tendae]|uniref:hypothetical protein n=1 Tax=Streptomyces tendae TaxID=1932 RepID=UPI003D746CEA